MGINWAAKCTPFCVFTDQPLYKHRMAASKPVVMPHRPDPNALRAMMNNKRDALGKQAGAVFKSRNAEGIDCFKCMILFVGKIGDKAKYPTVIVSVCNYKKEDLPLDKPGMDFKMRWNEEHQCAEMNAQKFRPGKGTAKEKRNPIARLNYPVDETDFTWVKVKPGTMIQLADFSDKMTKDLEGTFCGICDLYPQLNEDTDELRSQYWWTKTSWKFGTMTDIYRIPHQVMPHVVKKLPWDLFHLRNQALVGSDERCPLVFLRFIAPWDEDDLKEISDKPRFSYAELNRCTDAKEMSFSGTKTNAPATGDKAVVTALTVPINFKKSLRLTGMLQQYTGVGSKILNYAINITAWAEYIEEKFHVRAVDIWTILRCIVHVVNKIDAAMINVKRTRNTVGNSIGAGEEEQGEDANDAYLYRDTAPAKPAATASSETSAAAPASTEEQDAADEDAAALAALEQSNKEQVAAGSVEQSNEKFDAAISLNSVRGFFDSAAFYKRYGYPVSASWHLPKFDANKKLIGPVRKFMTRATDLVIKDIKKDTPDTDLEKHNPVICVSEYDKESFTKFRDWVKAGKGEFRVIPECAPDDEQLQRISTLTEEQSEKILDGAADALWKLERPTQHMFALFFINYHSKVPLLKKDGKIIDLNKELETAEKQLKRYFKSEEEIAAEMQKRLEKSSDAASQQTQGDQQQSSADQTGGGDGAAAMDETPFGDKTAADDEQATQREPEPEPAAQPKSKKTKTKAAEEESHDTDGAAAESERAKKASKSRTRR